ncbi:TIGR01440 family protein [Bacillus massilinigeriensis]|uniref:TIGR01440 family protein n=1 Tax=Bacillus massilionigeriensis TaxID=1805475 RepID=UPI00096B40E1|nr:TIGR01440 family protein [Bacillus massilionigeriensis]
MSDSISHWEEELHSILQEFQKQANLTSKHLLVIGCSTSEVIGKKIGTAGSEEVAEMIFRKLLDFQEATSVSLAFQCCEHLNRALVIERETAEEKGYDEVTVVPVRNAGGAMATYAYSHLKDAVVVEQIQAEAGIDIGNTLIGMHLKPVAVPIRVPQKTFGGAHVTLAKSRPKLIGGERAVYVSEPKNQSCS